ncbi:MAG: hypothetical protein IKK08_08405 [Clostridia bacterium]|jgi:hypothetical protein|nr:hypothetical protein [Clostridia bacterium]
MLTTAAPGAQWLPHARQELLVPDWVCPLCRTDWYHQPEKLRWVSEDMAVEYAAMNHPQVADGCAACALRRAALSQLRRSILLGRLEEPLLRQLLRIEGWQPEPDVLTDTAEAVYQYMPDAFSDAAREVIGTEGRMDMLWQVMKQDARFRRMQGRADTTAGSPAPRNH